METLITLIIFGAILFLPGFITDQRFNNRTSANGYKTDWGAMNHDIAMGKSQTEAKQKFNRGGYDIPDKK